MFGLFNKREKITSNTQSKYEKSKDIFSTIKSIENKLVFEVSVKKCLSLEKQLTKLKMNISRIDYPELYI